MNLAALSAEIERRRIELNKLGEILGERHPDLLVKSEQLDELIQRHMRSKIAGLPSWQGKGAG